LKHGKRPTRAQKEPIGVYSNVITLEEAEEVINAKTDDRFVILPKIKKGKTLYWIWGNKIVRFKYVKINGGCVVDGKFHVTCQMRLVHDVVIGQKKHLIKKGDLRYFYADDLDKKDIFTSSEKARGSLKGG
jgi:hypothetical protein